MIRVAVDAMGGDNAPGEIIKGALSAARERNDIRVVLIGREQVIRDEIRRQGGDPSLVDIVHAEEVIETGEHPVNALRKKKDSSIVVGMNLVKNGEADAFCSAGSSGAILAGGMLIVGRIKGVERPPLAPLIPTENGISLLIDCGANVDAKASNLVQFARMGSIYMKNVIGVENPRVGLVNIGVEEEKGNALAKETYPLLKACKDINFVGNIEAREIPHGAADVIVTEAFTGNVILKLYEGLGSTLIHMIKKGLMSTLISKIGALMAKPALKKSMKAFDVTEYGGAPLLGCKGLVVKTHGSAKAVEVHNTILQCITFTEQRINEKIQEALNAAEEAEKAVNAE
ncbi:phosphate acyltransferase PlsX [[Clostridium] aminophilum]|uniref:Phosphate acyltransferase n=1 Tax=[Clostridium] aminophilum TaxID=1526 RepID=A0A1I6JJM4_9FIRM|nr:phosphate acyltransferase PlsX [[Clostridium] aminophilum]SFR79084.1 phosphate:acyl-[acyl carrier protein] acyltransferase [[Clostridium] aminophilum]